MAKKSEISDPHLEQFQRVAGKDGKVDADELQACLTASGIAGTFKPFSKETCIIMVNMLDDSGKLGYPEFTELLHCLQLWMHKFRESDINRSGFIEEHELKLALESFKFNLSKKAMRLLLRRYSMDGRIAFDSFVALCIRIKALSVHFKRCDVDKNGTATFQFDEFVQVAMST